MLYSDVTKDMDFFLLNESRYLKIENYLILRAKRRYDKFMGPDFLTEPKLTLEEMQEKVVCIARRINRLYEMGAPEELIKFDQDTLIKTLIQIQNKEYAISPRDFKYRDNFKAKEEMFFNQK
ncbi:MAG: hypothetical protein VKN72_07630 [Nostocales cyanobacterium 94392]|nr:hypothetical protein [Nostocales cyanobacterium 94392]